MHNSANKNKTRNISDDENFTDICLCFDINEYYSETFHEIYMHFHSFKSKEEIVVEVSAQWKNIALNLNESKTVTVSPNSPATYLIRHAYSDDHNIDDRFLLNVETTKKYNNREELSL